MRDRRFTLRRSTAWSAIAGLALAVLAPILTSTPVQAAVTDICSADAPAQSGITVAPSHGKVFYIDSGVTPMIDAGYIGYKVTNNTGATLTGHWVELSNFTGSSVTLVNPGDAAFRLPDLASGASATAYFMVKAANATTQAQSHAVKVTAGRPDVTGVSVPYSCTYSFSKVQETIKAQANKVSDTGLGSNAAIEVSTTAPELGKLLTITIEGATGNIGSGSVPDLDIIWLTPAAISNWPTRALRLESVSMVIDGNGNWGSNDAGDRYTFTDTLLIKNAVQYQTNVQTEYRATFNFRVIGRPSSSVTIVPVAQIASGTQVKHSDIGATGATAALSFPTFTTNTTITKDSSVSATPMTTTSPNGVSGTTSYFEIPYSITATSTSATDTVIDEIIDQVPAGSIFKNGSATYSAVGASNVVITPVTLTSDSAPKPLHFVGPFTLKSGTPVTINYTMYLPQTAGNYDNSVIAKVGDQVLGASSTAKSTVRINSDGTANVTKTNLTTSFTAVAVTSPASSITTTTATLNGNVDVNGLTNYVAKYEYTTDPNFATGITTVTATTPASGALTGTDPVLTAVGLTGLTNGTTYYYRAIATDGSTTVRGEILSFNTLSVVAPPTATTTAATSITHNAGTLNGSIDPNLTTTTAAQFLYSTTSSTLASGVTTRTLTTTDDTGATIPFAPAGSLAQPVSYDLTGLSAGTTVYYKVRVCTASSGTLPNITCSSYVDGSILSFTTNVLPTITTNSPLPNGTASNSYSQTLAATGGSGVYTNWALNSGSTLPAGLALNASTGVISGTPTTSGTYSFTITVTDSNGATAQKTFSITILGNDPYALTAAPTSITSTSFVMNGSTDAKSFTGSEYFVSGTSATLASNTETSTPVSVVANAGVHTLTGVTKSGLTPATIYYYRASLDANSSTYPGAIVSVLTLPGTPTMGTPVVTGTSVSVPFTGTTTPGTGVTVTYTVTCTPSGGGTALTATGSGSPIVVNGLTAGGTYSCKVHATSAGSVDYGGGNSPESAAATVTAGSQTYTVTYDVNGGSGTAPTDGNAYTSGQSATAAAGTGLSRTGYTFAGWNTAANGTGTSYAAGATVPVNGNVALYAQWTANPYTLTYNLNNGSGTTPTGGTYTTGQGVSVDSGTAPTRTGYTFNGWNSAADGTGTAYAAGAQFAMPGGNLTLYAAWTPINYHVTYDANGGTGTAPSDNTHYVLGQSATAAAGTPLTRTGYTFAGWNTASNGGGTSYAAGASVQINGDVTLYAQWTLVPAAPAGPTLYPLTVTTSGSGSVSTASGSYASGTNVTISATPAPGYKFVGWGGACSGTSPTVTVSMTQAQSCTATFELMTTETKDSTAPTSPLVIEPTKTPGTTPGTITPPATPPGSTLIVSPTLLPTTKGIAGAQLKDGKVTYTAQPGFSGKTTVPLEYTAPNGQKTIILVPVTIDPVAPKEGAFTPKALNQTTLAWQPSPNAVAYEVRVNGKLVCSGASAASCDVKAILGPKAVIEVTALGNDGTRSTKVLPAYAPEKPVPAFTVNFDENKYNLKPLAIKKLNAFVKMMREQGFTKVFVEAHTDGQGGSKNAINLSNQRATATAKYLAKFLKVVINKVPAGEKKPVATNATETGRANNRRATGSVI